jgi:hypothetical protein
MTFFSSISTERKLHAIDARLLGVKEQLYSVLVTTGLNPDELNMETFNPETDLPENSTSLTDDVQRLLALIEQIELLRTEIAG